MTGAPRIAGRPGAEMAADLAPWRLAQERLAEFDRLEAYAEAFMRPTKPALEQGSRAVLKLTAGLDQRMQRLLLALAAPAAVGQVVAPRLQAIRTACAALMAHSDEETRIEALTLVWEEAAGLRALVAQLQARLPRPL